MNLPRGLWHLHAVRGGALAFAAHIGQPGEVRVRIGQPGALARRHQPHLLDALRQAHRALQQQTYHNQISLLSWFSSWYNLRGPNDYDDASSINYMYTLRTGLKKRKQKTLPGKILQRSQTRPEYNFVASQVRRERARC